MTLLARAIIVTAMFAFTWNAHAHHIPPEICNSERERLLNMVDAVRGFYDTYDEAITLQREVIWGLGYVKIIQSAMLSVISYEECTEVNNESHKMYWASEEAVCYKEANDLYHDKQQLNHEMTSFREKPHTKWLYWTAETFIKQIRHLRLLEHCIKAAAE